MYKHIVMAVALDHDHGIDQSLEVARRLLADDGTITALHVFEDLPGYASQYVPKDFQTEFHKQVANDLHLQIRDAPHAVPALISGHPGRSIVEYAKEHNADCIVIASHRPGLEDYFLGSTAARVVRHATCSVHVIR